MSPGYKTYLDQQTHDLAEVFSDVKTHQEVNEIVKRHATNPSDIREYALDNIDFTGVKKILDLGCGFGFFTQALHGKTNPEASVTGIDCQPKYKTPYMNSCIYAKIEGKFIGECITSIRRIKSNSIDLILCSYAMYFFSEILPHISRILKDNGVCIIITHSRHHLQELGFHIRQLLNETVGEFKGNLPFEALIDSFSGENGESLLQPFFSRIITKDFPNKLRFELANFPGFDAYIRFKHPFFIPDLAPPKKDFLDMLLQRFQKICHDDGFIEISKDDVIFICTEPIIKG